MTNNQETVQYNVVANSEFEFAPNFVIESESDNGMWTDGQDLQTIRVTVLRAQAGGFEQSLNTDSNVIGYEDLTDYSDVADYFQ